MRSKLAAMNPEQMCFSTINLNSFSDAPAVQTILEQPLEKKSGELATSAWESGCICIMSMIWPTTLDVHRMYEVQDAALPTSETLAATLEEHITPLPCAWGIQVPAIAELTLRLQVSGTAPLGSSTWCTLWTT